tara:strand:- start:547 stop:801 length:255 start_codon:yes stop_codon:yes gene_type:complete
VPNQTVKSDSRVSAAGFAIQADDGLSSYPNMQAWFDKINARPASVRAEGFIEILFQDRGERSHDARDIPANLLTPLCGRRELQP